MRTLPLYYEPLRTPIESGGGLERNSACRRCERGGVGRTTCIPAELVEGSDPSVGTILVIGEEPTFEEDTAGRPMVSRSRAIIRTLLKEHWRGNYVLEYAKKCHPWKEDKHAVEKCSPYVRSTFEEACPDRLLILGRRVAKAVLGRDVDELATRKGHSWVRHSSGKIIPVFVVMDPWDVAKKKNRFLRKYLKEDVKWALQDDQQLFDPPFNAKVHIVENADDAAVAIGELYNHDWVAYDAETSGRPWSKLFLCKSVAVTPAGSDDTYVWGPKALSYPQAVEALTDMMSDPILGKVGHNEKYDRMVFRAAFKTEVRGFILDTQLVRRLAFPGIDATLETCAELVGMGGHKQAFALRLKKAKKAITNARTRHNKSKGRQLSLLEEDPIIAAAIEYDFEDPEAFAYGLVPSPWLELYNASDTITTRRLALGPYGLAYVRKHAPTRNIWRNVVRNATPAIEQVEAWGIPVDRGGIEKFRAYADRELAEVTQRIQVYNIDPNSHQQVSKLLFGRLGLKNPHDPKSQSSDKKALKAMAGQHPVIADLIEHRRLAKLRSSYGNLDRFIREDGRIHPSLKIDGTESGRLSCVEPGLHQIPRAATVEAKLLKNCFAAAPGRLLLQLDYGQLEYRIAAYLSGDPVMRQMFLEGSDLHMQTARLISTLYWGIKAEEVGKEHRSQTKCFHPDTEVLTKGGWKRIPDLLPGEEVAQATPQDSAVDLGWVVPTEVFTQTNEHAELVHLKNEGIDVRVTPDHRMLVFRANGKHAVVLPSEFGRARSWKNSGVLHTTDTGEGSYPSEVLLRLAVALQADGTIRKTGYTTFGFSKSRKVERLRNLLSCAQIPWTETVNAKGVTTFTIQSQYSRSIRALLDGKCFSWRWLGLPLALRLAVLDEAPRWDGHTPKHAPHRKYFSTLKRNVDVLQAMAAISGVKTRLVPTPTAYSLTLKSKDGSRGANVTVNNVPYTGDVACLSVPSSFVLVRDGGVPVVTGQSFNFGLLYGMTDRTIAAMLNIPLEQAVKLRAVIMGKWKALQAWIDAQIAYAKATGTCRTFWNGEPARIRSLIAIANEGDDSASRGAQITARNGSYNTPIQGTASDFMLCSITKLVPWLRQSNLDAKLVLTVHDSVIFDVAEDHAYEMAARAESIMTAYETGGVPIVVDAEAGRAWGSLEKLELPKASVAAE